MANYYRSITPLLLLFITVIACTPNGEADEEALKQEENINQLGAQLIGTWLMTHLYVTFNGLPPDEYLPPEYRAIGLTLSPAEIEQIKENYDPEQVAGIIYEFRNDNSFDARLLNQSSPESTSSTWEVMADSLLVVEGSSKFEKMIDEITPNSLSLITRGSAEAIRPGQPDYTVVHQYHFIRQ